MSNPEQPEKMEMNIEELAEQYKAVFSQLAKNLRRYPLLQGNLQLKRNRTWRSF